MNLPRPRVDRQGFRTRRTDTSRLEGFSDGVFGFSLTLLVVALEVPKTFDQLVGSLSGWAAFAFCFAMIYYVWNLHYVYCRRFGQEDIAARVLTGLLLFLVTLYVYPLKFLSRLFFGTFLGMDKKASEGISLVQLSRLFQIYGAGFSAIFLVLGAMYFHSYRQADALEMDEVERYAARSEAVSMFLIAAIGVLSIALAAIPGIGGWPGFAYFLIGPIASAHGIHSGKRVRQLRRDRSHVEP